MSYHFFTNIIDIQSPQTSVMAFGDLPNSTDENGVEYERYNLENRFSVNTGAPAYAITDSLIIAVEDQNDSSLLNIALLPYKQDNLCGFPVKFIIYRGISKDSLINSDNNIEEDSSSWSNNNILDIIYDLQDKINSDYNENNLPSSDVLGLQFSSNGDETFLESIFFDNTDDFQPLLIPKGCQIGKFSGNNTYCSVQIILDKISYEPTLGILKKHTWHVLEIPKLIVDNNLSEKEKFKLKFKNRYQKEEILAYLDLTAFYGNCRNQSKKIEGMPFDDSFLDRFYNKEKVYIDIRDNWGNSYNCFYSSQDLLDIAFYNSTNEQYQDLVYNQVDYYTKWPILTLDNKSYPSSNYKNFFLKLPILIGNPERDYILSSFSKGVNLYGNKEERHIEISLQDKDGDIKLKESSPIVLNSWSFTNNQLGSNYFLLKLNILSKAISRDTTFPQWNNFFSLKMKNIFEDSNLEDGEFCVKTYSSLNAPLLSNPKFDEIFYPTIGIAVDKVHVSFFLYYYESAIRYFDKKEFLIPKLVETGKYKFAIDNSELNYISNDQAVGFLYFLPQLNDEFQYKLHQFKFTDLDNNLTDKKFINYIKSQPYVIKNKIFDSLEIITFTRAEFDALKGIDLSNLLDDDIIDLDHLKFIKSKDNISYRYKKFNIIENTVTVGVPYINQDDNLNFSVELRNYPDDILVNSTLINTTTSIPN